MSDYKDDDLVYVDPDTKSVVSVVRCDKDGNVEPLERILKEGGDASEEGFKRRKIFYPWCSYRTAKRVYNIEGKFKDEDSGKTLDEVMKLALEKPFWD